MSEPFKDAQKVKLKNGEEVELPRLTLGKIMAVAKSAHKLVVAAKEHAPQIFELMNGNTTENASAQLVQALPTVFPLVLGQVIDVMSDYLGKDKDWILETMDMEDLVNVATPFFENILSQGNHLLGPLNQAMEKATKTSKKSSE